MIKLAQLLCLTSAVGKVFAIKLKGMFQNNDNSDLQIGVRGPQRTSFKFWARALWEFSPFKLKARAQYGKLVLVVVLVLQCEGRYYLQDATESDEWYVK